MQWEYLIITVRSLIDSDTKMQILDKQGSDGWELITALYNSSLDSIEYTFKRVV